MDLTRFADDYWDAKDDSVDEERIAHLAGFVPSEAETLCVDAGPGFLPALIRERGHEVWMTDLSAHACKRAESRQLRARQVDTDDDPLPFEDDRFACVISDSAIEHRYYPERQLKECVRVLQPGGTLILLVPNIAHWRYRLALLFGRFPNLPGAPSCRSHLRMFAAPGLRATLRSQGLRITRTSGWASTWVKGLYPAPFRLRPVARAYSWLAKRWPSLLARDLIFVATKS